MARLLALDWDGVEARFVVARGDGNQLTVEQADAVPLGGGDAEQFGEQLKAALAKAKLPRCAALAAVGRAQIELRALKLPPAPADELPEMVRFQALREFSALTESAPLDFVPLGDAGTEPGEVMAVSIAEQLDTQIRDALGQHGHEVQRITMRPCSTASLALRRSPGAGQGVTMVIAQQADAAELIITKNGTVVFTRSVRLPLDWHPGESGEPLLGEVRRTIAAAQNQLAGARVEHVVLFGTAAEHTVVADRLRERTNLDVELVDPFSDVRVKGTAPQQSERYAALLGMLIDEDQQAAPSVDFANPRKAPEPESKGRTHVLLGATAATLVLAGVFMVWMQFQKLDRRIGSMKASIRKLERETKRLAPTSKLYRELEEWKQSDRNWLDELVHLSNSEALEAEDFRLESLTANARTGYPGNLEIKGRAKDATAQHTLQNQLADADHQVQPGRSWDETGDKRYPQAFTTSVRVNRSLPLLVSLPVQPAEPVANNADAKSGADATAESNPTDAENTDPADAADRDAAQPAEGDTPDDNDKPGEAEASDDKLADDNLADDTESATPEQAG